MKKFVAIITAIAVIMSFCTVFGVSAEENAGEITLSTVTDSAFTKSQVAKIDCNIKNTTGKPLGASLRIYIDGVLNEDESAGSDYFVIGEENNEKFEVMIPGTLDPFYSHTILTELSCDNGQTLYSSNVFTVSNDPANIEMKFFSTPLEIHPGVDLYYGIEFTAPEKKVYKGILTAKTGNTNVVESSTETVIFNGSKTYVCIPAKYNTGNPDDFEAEILLNEAGRWGIPKISLKTGDRQRYNELLKVITSVKIPAYVRYNTNAYAYSSLTGYVTTIPGGTTVEYMNPNSSSSMSRAKVKTPSGLVCWVPMSSISISGYNFTIPDTLTPRDREIFVNGKGYKSKTPYLLWVDKQRQTISVFMGKQGDWKLLNTFPVATGTNYTPTPTTVCEYTYRTRWVHPNYVCDPVLSLYDGYAIHNQPVSHSGYVPDRTIGRPASHGCIRMLYNDVAWIALTVPVKTTVVLF